MRLASRSVAVTEEATAGQPPNLARRVAVASFYAVLQRLVLRGIGMFGTIILARLLAPEDFGIVAVAAIVHTLLETLSTTSFHLALVRMPTTERVHYDTVFTMNLLRGLLIGLGLLMLAEPQARLMGDARVADVMRLLAMTVLLQSLQSPRMADFQRSLRFDQVLRFNVISKALLFVISIPLAFWLRNHWALVVGNPLSQLLLIPISYVMAPHRPRLTLRKWREFFHFSKWLLLGNVCGLVDGQLMNLLVGRIEGMTAVGLYQVAFQIAALPISEIAAPLRGPAFAGFARAQGDLVAMRRQFQTSLELQWIVILPMTAGLALTANELTLLFLGERWMALTPIMPLVALFALFDGLGHYTHGLQIVMNRQASLVLIWLGTILVRIPLVAWATLQWGLWGAAAVMLATGVVNAALWLRQAARMIELELRSLLLGLWRGTVAAATMATLVVLVPHALPGVPHPGPWPVVGMLAAKILVGVLAYPTVLLLLWRWSGALESAPEAHALRLIRAGLSRFGLSLSKATRQD